MGRYMMGRQCVREQGNIKNEKRQGREEDGSNEKVSKMSTIQTITRSAGENERPAQAEKSTALITPRRALKSHKKARKWGMSAANDINQKTRNPTEYRSNGKTTKRK